MERNNIKCGHFVPQDGNRRHLQKLIR